MHNIIIHVHVRALRYMLHPCGYACAQYHVCIMLYTPLQSYMALPKGDLVAEHVLILPIGHYAASTDTPQVSYNLYQCNSVMVVKLINFGLLLVGGFG